MNGLTIENPEKLTDTSFKITISGNDYEYEASEEKDIDKVVEKLNTWLERGPEAVGGLYDYIKRTFKLVGEYEEPIMEDPEPVDTSVDIPSDEVDIEEEVENQLEINITIEDDKVSISMNDWTGSFSVNDDDDFLDNIHDNIKEEMTLKDRVELIVNLVKSLEADDITDFYNLINLVLNNEVDIVDRLDNIEVEEPEKVSEEPTLDEPDGLEEPEEIQEESEKLSEDIDKIENDEEVENNEETSQSLTIDDLINNEEFIQDLISLDLSFFEITKEDNEIDNDVIYFIGGINNKGNKFSLSYSSEKPVELLDDFDGLKELDCCLNKIDDLNTVIDYVNKLLEITYNHKIKGDDNE